MMFDLQVLAFQVDITRVITFMMSREVSPRTYPEIGIPDPHHGLSHHGNNPAQMAKLVKINTLHMEQFAYFLDKLRATPDGDATLLDNVSLLYGGGISDSNQHLHTDLPILVVGGGAGADPRRPPPQGADGHAAGQPAADAAAPGGRHAAQPRRQHGRDRRTVCLI